MGRTRRHAATVEREEFYARFQITDTDLEQGTFEGYASVFGSLVDAWMPTTIERGAFTKTLAENKERVRILYQHDPRCLIGKPLTLEEDDKGLHIVGKISDTEMGREALTLIRDGVLAEMSIGFDPIQWEMKADPAAPADPSRQVRHLKEVRLWEVSLVTWAADPLAQVYAVHAMRTAPPALAWAPEAALARVRQWAGLRDAEASGPTPSEDGSQRGAQHRYSQAFVAGHLVADVVDGALQLVPVALARAGAALVVEQAKAMTADDAKALLQTAKDALEQVLDAANGEAEDDPELGPDGKPKKKTDEDEEHARAAARASLDARLMELTADAALVGVYS